jgi:hypothetical protein
LFLHENAHSNFLLKLSFCRFCFNTPFLFSSWKIHWSTGNEDETEDVDACLTNLKQDQLAEVNAGIEDVDDCFPPPIKSDAAFYKILEGLKLDHPHERALQAEETQGTIRKVCCHLQLTGSSCQKGSSRQRREDNNCRGG